jgi:hypothetical protein
MSKTMTTTEIEAAVDAELRGGYKRSRIYRQAMIDELQFRLNGTPMPGAIRAWNCRVRLAGVGGFLGQLANGMGMPASLRP